MEAKRREGRDGECGGGVAGRAGSNQRRISKESPLGVVVGGGKLQPRKDRRQARRCRIRRQVPGYDQRRIEVLFCKESNDTMMTLLEVPNSAQDQMTRDFPESAKRIFKHEDGKASQDLLD